MALTPTPVCVQNPKQSCLTFNSTYVANTITTLVTAGPNGNKIVAVTAVNTDSGAHVLQLWNRIGGVDALLTSFSVAANAGNDGATANGNVMSLWNGLARDNDGQPYFFVEPGATLGLSMTSTLAVGKTVYTSVTNGQF